MAPSCALGSKYLHRLEHRVADVAEGIVHRVADVAGDFDVKGYMAGS